MFYLDKFFSKQAVKQIGLAVLAARKEKQLQIKNAEIVIELEKDDMQFIDNPFNIELVKDTQQPS